VVRKAVRQSLFVQIRWVVPGAMALMACMIRPSLAQTAPNIVGTWQGMLQVDEGQRVVVKISKPADKPGWKAVYYNLDARMEGLGKLATSITFEGQTLQFAVGSIDAAYTAKLSPDGASLAGILIQNKLSHPLNLHRATEDTAWELPGADQNMPKDASPEFEVATIKLTPPGPETYSGFHTNGRHISCNDTNVFSIIMFAYGVAAKQIVGDPDWVRTELYDIDGVPDVPGQPNIQQMMGMFQKVLADRFHLTFHREKRELSAYALTVTKSGPKLAKSLGDPNGLPDETGEGDQFGATMRYTNVSMQDFAANMQAMGDGRPVVDQTELTGRFDFRLKFNREQTPSADPNAAPGLFTAMQEQLGLKLEPVKTPVDVIVIDHVERPSAN
jgi:uncharacterized protein (TIGR03435 family)